MLIPYSHRSPGSNIRGVVNAAFVQLVIPGVPVAVWYWMIPWFQIS